MPVFFFVFFLGGGGGGGGGGEWGGGMGVQNKKNVLKCRLHNLLSNMQVLNLEK